MILEEKTVLVYAFIVLVVVTGAANAAPWDDIADRRGNIDRLTCDVLGFNNDWVILSVIALGIAAGIITVIYMVSKLIGSAQGVAFCRAEIGQLVFSAIIIIATFTVVDTFICSGFLTGAVLGLDFCNNPLDCTQVYAKTSILYSHFLTQIYRYNQGVLEVRASQNRWDPYFAFVFFGGGIGKYFTPNAGDFGFSGVYSSGMMLALGYLFNSYLIWYVLLFGIYAFPFLFPIGIVLRCIPTLRHIGGVFLALSIVFLVIYPFAFSIGESTVGCGVYKCISYCADWPPRNVTEMYSTMYGKEGSEGWYPWTVPDYDPGEETDRIAGMEGPEKYSLPILVDLTPEGGKGNVAGIHVCTFLKAVFIPAVVWIVIIVAVRELSRLLGQEVDISRLGEMI